VFGSWNPYGNGHYYWASSFNADLDKWNTSGVTSMKGMFQEAHTFNGNVSTWDISQVTNMGDMFNGATSFDGDVSQWDTSNVMHMGSMFYGASMFNSDVSRWNTSHVTYFGSMFYSASSFNQTLCWNISNLHYWDKYYMLYGTDGASFSVWPYPTCLLSLPVNMTMTNDRKQFADR